MRYALRCEEGLWCKTQQGKIGGKGVCERKSGGVGHCGQRGCRVMSFGGEEKVEEEEQDSREGEENDDYEEEENNEEEEEE